MPVHTFSEPGFKHFHDEFEWDMVPMGPMGLGGRADRGADGRGDGRPGRRVAGRMVRRSLGLSGRRLLR